MDEEKGSYAAAAVAVRSRKLTWKPKKGPIKTTVLLQEDYVDFHVSLGECSSCRSCKHSSSSSSNGKQENITTQ